MQVSGGSLLWVKISAKKVKDSDNKSYLGCFNKLVDKYSNTCHCSTGKKTIHPDCFTLPEKFKSINKAPKFKTGDTVRITKRANIFGKGCTENWSKKIFVINSVLKANPWIYKYSRYEAFMKNNYSRVKC